MEIDRIKEFKSYDVDMFNRLYKQCKPLIKSLVYTIDSKRLGVDKDIIKSYFDDKFMFVFSKWGKVHDEKRLKILMLSSLQNFKNRLLRMAYTNSSEFYLGQVSIDDSYDMLSSIPDEDTDNKERLEIIFEYMKTNLSPEALLLFTIELYPPEWFIDRVDNINSYNKFIKFSNYMYLEYFELPKTKTYSKYISSIKNEIEVWLNNLTNPIIND